VTITGDTDGIDANAVLTQMNAGLSGTGIVASLNGTGKLQFKSSNAFAITVAAAVGGAATAVNAAIANNAAVLNSGKYRFDGGAFTDYAGGEAQVYRFTPSGSTSTAITIASGTNVADALVAFRNGLAGKGIDVVLTGAGSGTSYISFQSSAAFTLTNESATGAATGGMANLADGALPTPTSATVSAQSQSTDPTSDAAAALSAISAAVTKLGVVQGRVGTGQNQLSYSINLAQSQISAFSAAESRIRDADVAQEAANLTKAQVLQQASLAAMAQANSAPQAVLALLRG
jgi:flagellin